MLLRREEVFSTSLSFLIGTVTALQAKFQREKQTNSSESFVEDPVQERANRLGMVKTGRPKRVDTPEENHMELKAVTKRDLKWDCGEDVSEADDIVKWEDVEGRRRQSGTLLWPCDRTVN